MENKHCVFLVFTLLVMMACNEREADVGPLITVIKLQSAEENLLFEDAVTYIDVERVYSDYAQNGCSSAIECWKEKLTFLYNLNKDEKFTNHFQYHKFDVKQKIEGNKSHVTFISLKGNVKIKEIKYKLELKNDKWIVVEIKYI